MGKQSHRLPLKPPIEPMLAKVADAVPAAGGFLYEPKISGRHP